MAAKVNSNQNYTFQLEQREHFVFFQVNQCKVAIFDKDANFQNFRFRAPDCNVIILGSIEVEDAIEIEALNTVVLGKLQSFRGDSLVRCHNRVLALGGEGIKLGGKSEVRSKTVGYLMDVKTDGICRVFHEAIAQASPHSLCLGLREMVQTILSRENSSAQRPDMAEQKE